MGERTGIVGEVVVDTVVGFGKQADRVVGKVVVVHHCCKEPEKVPRVCARSITSASGSENG